MKRILISLSLIGAVAAIAVTATRAYFSDTETSAGNTFTAATLDLKVNNQDGPAVVHLTKGNLYPSPRWSKNWGGDFVVKNTGSIPGQVTMKIMNVQNYENGCADPETKAGDATCGAGADQGELGALMFAKWLRNVPPWGGFGSVMSPFNAAEGVVVTGPTLAAGASDTLNLDMEWDTHSGTTDNTAQGDSLEFDIVFSLNQVVAD